MSPSSASCPDAVPPMPWGSATGGLEQDDDDYGDVGEWLPATFSVLRARIGPVAALLLAVPVAGFIPMYALLGVWALWPMPDNIGYSSVGPEDIVPLPVVLGIPLAMLGGVIIVVVGWLGLTHQLYAAHAGRPQSIRRSISTGFWRVPRTIGYALVAPGSYIMLVVAMPSVPGHASALVDAASAPGPLALMGAVVGWAAIRFGFVGVALAVCPSGSNPFSASWRLTRGRWWRTCGRLLPAFLLAAVTWMVVYRFILFPPEDGRPAAYRLYVEGFPGPRLIVAFIIIQAQQAISIAAIPGLYFRGNGPAEI